jgi:nucleoside-diphosphate-sugar epimerase
MKALVIGGAGPTGPFIIEGLLKRGYEVTILHRGFHEAEYSQVIEDLHGDPFSMEGLEKALGSRKFDLVISMYGRLRYVVEVMKGRTPRLIAVTGAPVYLGWMTPESNPDGLLIPVPEEAPLMTDSGLDNVYGQVAPSEEKLMEVHRQGYYSATIFRYPQIYGPRNVIQPEWNIVKRLLDGRKRIILPEAGLTLMSRCYSENAAHALLMAVEQSRSGGQKYNVADERVLTCREWVVAIAQIMGKDVELINMSWESAKSVAMAYTYGIHHRVLDIAKIKAELGYRDVVGVFEGLKRTVNWLLENPPGVDDSPKKNISDLFDYDLEDRIIEQARLSKPEI